MTRIRYMMLPDTEHKEEHHHEKLLREYGISEWSKPKEHKEHEKHDEKHEKFEIPETWTPYLNKQDYTGIVTMEFNEFIAAERNKNKEKAKMEAHHLRMAIDQYLNH